MSTRVKICGITDVDELETAVNAGADAIGVIHDVPIETPREVSRNTASTLFEHAPPFVTSVLVTMPQAAEPTLGLTDELRPDVIQIHGSMSTADVGRIAEEHPVIRAVDVGDDSAIADVEKVADAILIDSTDEHGAGGTGQTHDWTKSQQYVATLDVPVILAGGLTPDNVGDAIERVRPFAVDVATGVEGPDGKDPAAVRRFVDAATGGG